MKKAVKQLYKKVITLLLIEAVIISQGTIAFSISRKNDKAVRNIDLYKTIKKSVGIKKPKEMPVNMVCDNRQTEKYIYKKLKSKRELNEVKELEKYTKTAFKNEDTIIEFKKVKLIIPKGALKEDVDITIEELGNVSTLNPDMVNITDGVAGYRFTPSMKFNKNITIILPYNKESIMGRSDILNLYTYFYDEEKGCWEKLKKANVDEEKGIITSITNHFTDMINSILKLPESPKPLSFNPTSIKDIKAADPMAGVPGIEGLEPNTQGSAQFSLPLRIPAGRNGVAPQLSLSYNSEIKNGWLGVGFDINIPSITIDTKFGVPKYDGTDLLVLNGEDLLKILNTNEYKTRIESYSKIIKNGESFEITDNTGTKYIYGEYNGEDDAVLDGGHGGFKWYIKKVINKNGNTIAYEYDTYDNYKYLKNIYFTGYNSDKGKYKIEFLNESSNGQVVIRNDVIINCRGKFISKMDRRLGAVLIYYGNDLIRKYILEYRPYNESNFGKSELSSIIEYDNNDNEFYRYNFEYHDMEKNTTDPDGYNGFMEYKSWAGAGRDFSLNKTESESSGGGFYAGFGFFRHVSMSITRNYNFGTNTSMDRYVFIDINGDGLPDQVKKSGDQLHCRLNNGSDFNSDVKKINGFNTLLNENRQDNYNNTTGISFSVIGGGKSKGKSYASAKTSIADVDGDGFIDVVDQRNPLLYFKGNGVNGFTEKEWILTGGQNTQGVNVKDDELYSTFHLLNPVVKWKAYHMGKLKIKGNIELEETGNLTVSEELKIDGVKLNLYKNNSSVWNNINNTGNWDILIPEESERVSSILLKDEAGYTRIASHEDNIDVERGDRLYFTANSINNVKYDKVNWDPEIYYTEVYPHDNIELYRSIFFNSLSPALYINISDSIADNNDKDFFEESYTYVDNNNGNSYYSNSRTDINDRYRLNAIIAEAGYIIPKYIQIDDFEKIFYEVDNSNAVYGEDPKLTARQLLIKNYVKDFVNNRYTLLSENGSETIYNILNSSSSFASTIKYKYQYYPYPNNNRSVYHNGECMYALIKNTFVKQKGSDIGGDGGLSIGSINEKGILIEKIITDNGDEYIKWLKDEGNTASMFIEHEGSLNPMTNYTSTVKENSITITEDAGNYQKVFIVSNGVSKIDKPSDFPRIHSSLYEPLFYDQIPASIDTDDFNDNIIGKLGSIDDIDFMNIVYEEDINNNVYNLKNGLLIEDYNRIIRILITINYISSYYIPDGDYYRIKANIDLNGDDSIVDDMQLLKTFLLENNLYLDYSLRREIRALSTGRYDVVYTGYTSGVNEELINTKGDENNSNKDNVSYILVETYDNEGNTIEERYYIHVFKLSKDFSDNNLVDIPSLDGQENIAPSGDPADNEDLITNNTNRDDLENNINLADEFFSGGVYNWYYGSWNGNIDSGYQGFNNNDSSSWDEGLISYNTSQLDYTYFQAMLFMDESETYDIDGTDDKITNPWHNDMWLINRFDYIDKYYDSNADVVEEEKHFACAVIKDEENDTCIFMPTRVCGDSIDRVPLESGELSSSGLYSIRNSKIKSNNDSASAFMFGGSDNDVDTKCYRDFFDINGDRYPDQIVIDDGNLKALLNEGGTGFKNQPVNMGSVFSNIRHSQTDTNSNSITVGSIASILELIVEPSGRPEKFIPIKPSFAGDNLDGKGDTILNTNFIDINGDGLPDHIRSSGNGDFEVRLNLGDSFSDVITWDNSLWDNPYELTNNANDFDELNHLSFSEIESKGKNAGAGYGIGVSTSVFTSFNRTKTEIIDINGDGLPDRLYKGNDDYFYVKYNLGSKYADAKRLYRPPNPDNYLIEKESNFVFKHLFNLKDKNIDRCDYISYTSNFNVSVGVAISTAWGSILPYPYSLYLHFGFNVNAGNTFDVPDIGETSVSMIDIDGDGLPDHVFKSSNEDNVIVKLNNAKKVGLLSKIYTPVGGRIELEYDEAGNTVDMPFNRNVLRKVTKYSGYEYNDTEEKGYTVEYEYADGYYSRAERNFFGFEKIIIRNADGTYTENNYYDLNDELGYYKRGILLTSTFNDNDGKKLSILENNYSFEDLYNNGNIYFPRLNSTATVIYESGESITTGIEYTNYDLNTGNILQAVYKGDVSKNNDDIYITVKYDAGNISNHIFTSPSELIVRKDGFSGPVLRSRNAIYDNNGNPTSIEQYLADMPNPIYKFGYDQYGNLNYSEDPKGHGVTYYYDDEVHIFIERIEERIENNQIYYSLADYNKRLSVQLTGTDMNNNTMTNVYDSFGRLVEVRSPYDTGSTPAVKFTYYPYDKDSHNPARAVTMNKIHFNPADTETLDTVIAVDGLRRVLQTKKEGEAVLPGDENASYGMNVTGLIEYDNMGRVIKQGQPVFQYLTGDYDAAKYEYYEDTEMLNPTENKYDIKGRVTKTILPDESSIETKYEIIYSDKAGANLFKTTVTDPNGKHKVSYMDARENIIMIDQFNNGKTIRTSYEYNLLSEILEVMDADGNTTKIEYDSLGRRTSINNPDSGKVTFVYDICGNLKEKVDANLKDKNHKIAYEYDTAGRLIKIDYPNMPDVEYYYGAPGAASNRAGRLYRIMDESGVTEFEYGLLGEQTNVIKTMNTLTEAGTRTYLFGYLYDYLGRVEQIIYPGTYNRTNGAIQPPEIVHYEYDKGGQVKRVYGSFSNIPEPVVYIDNLKYDTFGQRVYIRYGNGVETKYAYDEKRRWLDQITTQNTNINKIYQNMTYKFDKTGNILSISNNAGDRRITQGFEYDDLYQLVNAAGSYNNSKYLRTNSYTQTFIYDDIGNITNKLSIQNANTGKDKNLNYNFTYIYDEDHPHRAVKIGDLNYEYDLNGNLTKKYYDNPGGSNNNGGSENEETINTDPNSANEAFGYTWEATDEPENLDTQYTWDDENRLKVININNNTTQYLYDAGGQRTSKLVQGKTEVLYVDRLYQIQIGVYKDCITKHIFAGDTRIVSKITYEDLYNNAEVEQNNTYFYHADHLGSSNFIIDKNGYEYEHIEYTPYGETWFEESQEPMLNKIAYKFTGKELDTESGLYYFGARYYDPKVSRWISTDPIYDGVLISGSIFGYCRNNPIMYVDPDGLAPINDEKTKKMLDNEGIKYEKSDQPTIDDARRITKGYNQMIKTGMAKKLDDAGVNNADHYKNNSEIHDFYNNNEDNFSLIASRALCCMSSYWFLGKLTGKNVPDKLGDFYMQEASKGRIKLTNDKYAVLIDGKRTRMRCPSLFTGTDRLNKEWNIKRTNNVNELNNNSRFNVAIAFLKIGHFLIIYRDSNFKWKLMDHTNSTRRDVYVDWSKVDHVRYIK